MKSHAAAPRIMSTLSVIDNYLAGRTKTISHLLVSTAIVQIPIAGRKLVPGLTHKPYGAAVTLCDCVSRSGGYRSGVYVIGGYLAETSGMKAYLYCYIYKIRQYTSTMKTKSTVFMFLLTKGHPSCNLKRLTQVVH